MDGGVKMIQRTLRIIKLLINSSETMTISFISEKLDVSNRTIRNDMKEVEKLLLENGLKLVKKTGVGVYIEGDEKSKLEMLTKLKSFNYTETKHTSKDRQLYIIYQLLTNLKKTTITSLQNELFISRPSVYSDIDRVRKWFSDRDIEVLQNKARGIYLHAGEKRIRKAMFDLFNLCEKHDQMIDMMENSDGHDQVIAFNYFSYAQKEDVLGVDYDRVNKIINHLETLCEIKFTSDELKRLTIKYALAISRMVDGNFVDMRQQTISDLSGVDNYEMIKEIAHEIEREFDINVPESELAYLTGITIVAKTHFESSSWNISEESFTISKVVAQEIIELVKAEFRISDEETLFNGLLHHLKSVANKIKYGLDFYNPIVDDMRNNYPEVFAIAQKCVSIFEEFYHYTIPVEEVGYIAIHIASAIERSKQPIKVCMVYHSSYSEVKLMLEILKNNLNYVQVDKVYPVSMLETIDTEHFDLIITTQSLKQDIGIESLVIPTSTVFEGMKNFVDILRNMYESSNAVKLKKCHK